MIEWLILIGSVALAVGIQRRYPQATRRWYRRIKSARRAIFAVLGLLFALAFIFSGVLPLMLIGGLSIAYATLQILFENPQEDLLAWIR